MDKTDAALANVIGQILDAASAMSGPAYQILLETARAKATADLIEAAIAIVACAIAIFVLVKFVTVAVDQDKKTGDAHPLAVTGALISGIAALFCVIWTLVGVSQIPMNVAIARHPEVAIGNAVIRRISGHKE